MIPHPARFAAVFSGPVIAPAYMLILRYLREPILPVLPLVNNRTEILPWRRGRGGGIRWQSEHFHGVLLFRRVIKGCSGGAGADGSQ